MVRVFAGIEDRCVECIEWDGKFYLLLDILWECAGMQLTFIVLCIGAPGTDIYLCFRSFIDKYTQSSVSSVSKGAPKD